MFFSKESIKWTGTERGAHGGLAAGAALRSLVVVAWRWIADGIVKFIVNAIAGHTQSHFGYRGRA